MIIHFDADAVSYREGRPVAVADQQLTQPTAMARTGGGFWGLYAAGDEVVVVHPAGAVRGRPADVRAELEGIVGDQGRDDAERQAVAALLPFLGRAGEAPVAVRTAPPAGRPGGVGRRVAPPQG
jgi:hypothetical protein